ncbi:MAG: tetratricopeptide repeat protein [Candidatus Nanopelagicales bacterium]|jgi:putative thioredoxin|nr:tetratricopeptide repeat protein [Candidatus Nanopelagicales bacterium]MBJ7393387.1 tetratricopeptide repeat protein [Candidatus Nanopelagicales bacterium]
MRGAIDLGALAQSKKDQSMATQALANAPAGVVVDVNEEDFQQKVIDISKTVPVIVDLWAEWCGPCKQLSPLLEKLAAEYKGRFILAKIDVDANPRLSQMFQVQSIPAVFAVIGESAGPLFQGAIPEAELRQVIEEVLRIAAEQGINGTIDTEVQEEVPVVEEEQIDPRLEAAFNAIEKGDFVAATNAYKEMLNQNPADQVALAGLAQVGLLERASKLDPNTVLQKASDRKDFASQMDLADLELMKGNPGAGFAILINAIKIAIGEDRDRLRARLLELFMVVGDSDPEVIKARRDLASALF